MDVLEGQGHITNPLGYVTALFEVFQKNGGKFIKKSVKNLNTVNDHIYSVQLEDEEIICQKAVVTSGIWSKNLIKNLKIKVPLETERGYHIVYEKPSMEPRNPMMITEGKFAVTPMTTGLRCAGTVELGGLNASASRNALERDNQFPQNLPKPVPNLQVPLREVLQAIYPRQPKGKLQTRTQGLKRKISKLISSDLYSCFLLNF